MKFATNTNKLTIIGLITLFAVFIVGCSQPADTPSPAKGEDSAASTPVPSTPAAFTNDKGQILCPVMGTVVEDKSKAVGYQDYNGKRYYFCCGSCPDEFKADPAKFEDGKAL
ncbi:MAG: YHS domain-containing protein [Fimbriimonadaceae bacterium]|nr:YHS domain-containing protein [Fimbriimonadaceae bacterium]